jgi:hypothetical protein
MRSCQLYQDTGMPKKAVFSRIIAFDWYDGPLSGLAKCGCCDPVYLLSPLAMREALELRVFALFPRELDQFDALASTLSATEAPRWPTWVPNQRVDLGGRQSGGRSAQRCHPHVAPNASSARDARRNARGRRLHGVGLREGQFRPLVDGNADCG